MDARGQLGRGRGRERSLLLLLLLLGQALESQRRWGGRG